MIEIKITGENAAAVVAEMQDLLCGAWLNDKQVKQSAREAVAIDTAVKAAANGANIKIVPAPMTSEEIKAAEKAVEKALKEASEEPATAEDVPALETVRAALAAAMKTAGRDKTHALLTEFAPKLSQVKPSDLSVLLARAQALA